MFTYRNETSADDIAGLNVSAYIVYVCMYACMEIIISYAILDILCLEYVCINNFSCWGVEDCTACAMLGCHRSTNHSRRSDLPRGRSDAGHGQARRDGC